MKIKLPFLFTTFVLNSFLNIYAQSQDQNYVKTSAYLETVLVESDFTTSFSGWEKKGNVSYTLDNNRLKVNVDNSWEGIKHDLHGFKTITGEVLNIQLVFDKGNTQSNIRLYLKETDPNGNLVNYNQKDGDIQTGTHFYSHTMANSDNTITLTIDKSNTNTNIETYFYVDYISLKVGGDSSSIKKLENVTYLDGFGKPKQIIAVKNSPNQKDILQHIEYDQFGRNVKQYLPLASNQSSGNYITNAQSQINTYYQNEFADQHPFAEARYEDSPLNRKLESSAPGNTWQLNPLSDNDHTTKYDYNTNTPNEVYEIEINDQDPTNPLSFSFYPAGVLVKNIIKNENWTTNDGVLNTKEVFTDKNGRKVAEFNYESENGTPKKLSTYYVHDKIGNLRYVLTPKMFPQSSTIVNYDDYSIGWPTADFVSPSGYVGMTRLFIFNNVLTLSFLKKNIGELEPFPLQEYTLNLQTTKTLSTSPSIPDMYLGKVMANTSLFGAPPIEVGEASIVNGDLVITRTSSAQFTQFNGSISVNLNSNINISQADLNDLAFQYKYDQFNRQIEQKVPGKDWEYMVYDQLDRPILTQDANLRAQNKWLFNKYDVFGRVVYSGKYTNSAAREALQTQVDNFINNSTNKANIVSRTTTANNIGGTLINYTNNAFPNSNQETLTVSYYDDYNFTDSSLPTIPTNILGQEVTDRTKGLLTATFTKTLGSSTWSKNYTFYDKKGRVIYIHDKNHLGGYTENESKLDFRGKVEQSITTHKRLASNNNLTIEDTFEYDHAERPLKHYQTVNSQSQELIAKNEYNELGQLTTKRIGGADNNNLQNINYAYNIRGWLTQVNDVNNLGTDLFAYKLKYDEAIEGSASVNNVYNGNIKQVIWKSAQNNIKKSYAFEYDKMNRFSRSIYRENNSLTGGSGKFETFGLGYDPNGNILALKRSNQLGQLIDKLSYSYDTGNVLLSVGDAMTNPDGFNDGSAGNDYTYDNNGNLISDANKGITNIVYNHLDLVEQVTFNNGNRIEFTYDANGTKLQMKNIYNGGLTSTTDYLGGFQYTQGVLRFFPTPEGYVAKDGSTYKYVYIYKDHLGNNRLSFCDNNQDFDITPNEILSNTDHYVMGLTHNGEYISGLASNYNYKFQGKEQLAFAGYNMYNFGSRMYDPAVGRWFNTDPQNQFWSPYLAMGNNYIIVKDPNGEWVHIVIGAVVGGVINTVANWDNIDSFGDGLAYFGIGAASGAVTAATGNPVYGGMIIGAGNSFYTQYDQNDGNVDYLQVFGGAVTGGATAGIGAKLSPLISPYTDKLFSNAGNQIAQRYLSDAVSNTVSGFGITTFSGLAQGYSFNESINMAVEGIPQSLAISAIGTTGSRLNTKYYQNKQEKQAQLLEEELKRIQDDPDLNKASKNAALFEKLKKELSFNEKNLLFNPDGTLKPEVILKSQMIINGSQLGNTALKAELLKIGGNLSDWYKMSFTTGGSNGIDVHYYYNFQIQKAYYGLDYKAILGRDYLLQTPPPKQ